MLCIPWLPDLICFIKCHCCIRIGTWCHDDFAHPQWLLRPFQVSGNNMFVMTDNLNMTHPIHTTWGSDNFEFTWWCNRYWCNDTTVISRIYICKSRMLLIYIVKSIKKKLCKSTNQNIQKSHKIWILIRFFKYRLTTVH